VKPYSEVESTLALLARDSRRCAILSNGNPAMLHAALRSSGLAPRFEAVLSADAVSVFKPDPRVYQLAVDRLATPPAELLFISSNGWDAAGARGFGLPVTWVNRSGAPIERLGFLPDLADHDSLVNLVARTRAEFGPIDILVNNAGYAVWKSLESTTMAEWDQTFAVNLRAAAYLCAAVLPDMQARGFGRVINIGSEAGVAIVPGLAAYCVSKHALGALTEVIQEANHDNGIKAWVVCPGFVDTDIGYVVPGAEPENFLRVEEVVDVVRFLLHTGDNVKLGPEVLIRTMRNPMPA
jgi:NAD(P)-dependent dehydrogenase (short-subunit alcohol dehydrogenase family)